ncbi:MAG: hypothetical protein ACI4OL_01415 [Gemmiger sp.]
MKKLRMILPALFLCLLSACGGEREVRGKIVGTETDKNGLAAFLVETDEGKKVGVRLTEGTFVYSFADGMDAEAFRSGEMTDVAVSVKSDGTRGAPLTQDGRKVRTYQAERIEVTGYRRSDGVVLADGTPVELWQYSGAVAYTLQNGTELLRVQNPTGPDRVYTGGGESLERLEPAAQERIAEFYRERGVLYDERAGLEAAYAEYCSAQDPSSFDAYLLSQEITPAASSDRVIYFMTCVLLPVDGTQGYECRLGEAFDRTTGEPVGNETLFTCSPEQVLPTILDLAGVADPVLRAEMEQAFLPEYLGLDSENLWVCFPQGTLPSQEHTYFLELGYPDGIGAVLHDWAVPTSRADSAQG